MNVTSAERVEIILANKQTNQDTKMKNDEWSTKKTCIHLFVLLTISGVQNSPYIVLYCIIIVKFI